MRNSGKEFLEERINLIESNYRDITFHIEVSATVLHVNKDSFTRIIDNLLSNAAKYNIKNGQVFIRYSDTMLEIQDTGKGIKNPKRVFERFYKEQERGIGIGLHIVKKLCEELGIDITLQSEVGKGTIFQLNLKNII